MNSADQYHSMREIFSQLHARGISEQLEEFRFLAARRPNLT
jgi:hypothetical protein